MTDETNEDGRRGPARPTPDEERTDDPADADPAAGRLPAVLDLPLETPEPDALEQAQEVPVDDDTG